MASSLAMHDGRGPSGGGAPRDFTEGPQQDNSDISSIVSTPRQALGLTFNYGDDGLVCGIDARSVSQESSRLGHSTLPVDAGEEAERAAFTIPDAIWGNRPPVRGMRRKSHADSNSMVTPPRDYDRRVGGSPAPEVPSITPAVALTHLPLPMGIMGQLTLSSEAMGCLMLPPTLLTRLDTMQAATSNELLLASGSTNRTTTGGVISKLLSRALLGVVWGYPRQHPSLVAKRGRVLLIGSFVGTLTGIIMRRLTVRSRLALAFACVGVGAWAYGAMVDALRWALVPPALTRRSPFGAACRSIALLKAAQTSLTAARIVTTNTHHVANRSGADLVHMQQQWLVHTLLDDGCFASASYATTPQTTLGVGMRLREWGRSISRATSPRNSARTPFYPFEDAPPSPPQADVSPEEVEILIARSQHSLWQCVKYMALLAHGSAGEGASGDGGCGLGSTVPINSYTPGLGDVYKLFKGVLHLRRHGTALEALCSRLGEGFGPPCAMGGREAVPSSASTFAFHELFTHAQRLSGQLFLLRAAEGAVMDAVSPEIANERRREALADVADIMGALAGAWNRISLSQQGLVGAPRTAGLGGMGGVYGGGPTVDDGDDAVAPSGGNNQPTRAEMSAQGEDPIPLFPTDEMFDSEVGSKRGTLPDNFADLLAAMRKKK